MKYFKLFLKIFLLLVNGVSIQANAEDINSLTNFKAETSEKINQYGSFTYNSSGNIIQISISLNDTTHSPLYIYSYIYDSYLSKITEKESKGNNNNSNDLQKRIYLLDEANNVHTQIVQRNIENKGYSNQSKFTYIYDNSNNLQRMTEYWNDEGYWMRKKYKFWGYNENNLFVYFLSRKWNGKIWNDLLKTYHSYNNDNKLNRTIFLQYYTDIPIHNFEKSKTNIDYNKSGYPTLSLTTILADGKTYEDKKIKYKYDIHNNLTEYMEFSRVAGNLVLQKCTTYVYDSRDNLIVEKCENRNNDILTPTFRYDYTYDNSSNRTGKIIFKWLNKKWKKQLKIDKKYDDRNNLTSITTNIWIDNKWNNHTRVKYEYNQWNNMISGLSEKWDNSVWIPNDIYFYIKPNENILNTLNYKCKLPERKIAVFAYKINLDYENITKVEQHKRISNHIIISPNPTTDYININTNVVILNSMTKPKIISKISDEQTYNYQNNRFHF